jgi:type II secretory pathway pseudopilin PulG
MKKQRQFTLIEILAVITIIMILAGVAIGVTAVTNRKSMESKTKSIMKTLEWALEEHREDYGFYPRSGDPAVDNDANEFDLDDQWYNISNWTWYDKGESQKIITGSSLEGYSETFQRPNGGTPYLDEELYDGLKVIDAYGNAFQYECPGTHNRESYDLWSEADGIYITNWSR